MDYRLTDEEIKTIEGQVFYESQPAGYGFDFKVQRAVADAQIAKLQKYYAELGEEELREGLLSLSHIKRLYDTGYLRDKDIDQILSLVMGWKENKG